MDTNEEIQSDTIRVVAEPWLMLDFFQRALDLAEVCCPKAPAQVDVTASAVSVRPVPDRVRLIAGVGHLRLEIDGDTVASGQQGGGRQWLVLVNVKALEGELAKLMPPLAKREHLDAERRARLGL